ncbi:MAG: hypothetical protein Q9224_000003 [Gallowayella concinna]
MSFASGFKGRSVLTQGIHSPGKINQSSRKEAEQYIGAANPATFSATSQTRELFQTQKAPIAHSVVTPILYSARAARSCSARETALASISKSKAWLVEILQMNLGVRGLYTRGTFNRKEPGLKINARYYYLIAFANTRIADQQDESQPGVWQPGAHTSAASPDPHLQLFEQNLEIQFHRRASAHYMEGDDQWNNESAMVLGEASLTLLEASGGSLANPLSDRNLVKSLEFTMSTEHAGISDAYGPEVSCISSLRQCFGWVRRRSHTFR